MPANSPPSTEELDVDSDGSSSTFEESPDTIPITPGLWPPEEWEVSKILGQNTTNGVQYYLLLWMPSWVPETQMSNVDGVHTGAWLHEEEWKISEILESRMFMGMLHYLVEWMPSWVSEFDAENASELIEEWYAT
ncbi:hypothetical protein HJFPF1_13583 [Paramyrothecium foliicola]|nr:hypothetical protein HJFPF1_13583 [Paramyrothecium foliicola]